MLSTNLVQWQIDSTHTLGPNGLFQFYVTNAPTMPPTFLKAKKP